LNISTMKTHVHHLSKNMKILVSDFDYTFFTLDYLSNIEAVQKFVNDENIFIIATSRCKRELLEDITDFYVPYFFLICDNGAIIYNRKHEIMKKIEMDINDSKDIFNKLYKSKNINETYKYIDDFPSTDDNEKTTKIVAKYKDYDKAEKELNKILEENSNITGNITESWISIVNKTATKGSAIEFICEKYKFNKDDVYVIGDNYNDISMFEKYKGYAIKESPEELINKSIGVVETFHEVLEKINEA
jgi:HAD-superfamily hydrolase, subfamily IIB